MRRALFWICSTLVSCCSLLGAAAQHYPAISPVQRSFDVPEVDRADVMLVIQSRTGKPQYKLQCHSAGYTGDPHFDYSGDFECRLSSVGHRGLYSTLLTEDMDQSRDWESRGRFFASDLRGACALVPEFGATRNFRLRGMDLTLQITDPKFTEAGKLSSLRLTVIVRPDRTARRPIAEVVPVPKTGIPAGCEFKQHFVDLGGSSNSRRE